MNPDNYGTLSACQKLVEAGVVMETEAYWVYVGSGYGNDWKWSLSYSNKVDYLSPDTYQIKKSYPAVSFAEMWREMPEWTHISKGKDNDYHCWVNGDKVETIFSTNPTDSLIHLRIWLEGRRKSGISNRNSS